MSRNCIPETGVYLKILIPFPVSQSLLTLIPQCLKPNNKIMPKNQQNVRALNPLYISKSTTGTASVTVETYFHKVSC